MTSPPRVRDSELDFDSDLVCTLAGEPFTGIAFEETPDGVLSEIPYRNGLQEGKASDWYPSGQVKAESEYIENVLHGRSREFDEAGNLLSESLYEYGVLVKRYRSDSAGALALVDEIDPDSAEARLLARYRKEKNWPL